EASGLAEPHELLRLLVNSKNQHARFDSMVAVVDASNVLDTKEKHPAFMEQLSMSDIMILNKVDLVKPTKLKEVEGYLKFINSKAHIIHAENGKVDSRLLLAPEESTNSREQLSLAAQDDDHATHLHHTYQKVS